MTAIAITIGIIVSLGVAAFVAVHLYAYGTLILDSRRLRSRLSKQDRVLSLTDAKKKINSNQGSIIVDAPTLGWNVSRIWWSPMTDIALRTCKTEEDEFFPPEDAINYDRFIDERTGIACLVNGFVFTQSVSRFLKHHFGITDCPYIFTGGVLFQRKLDKQNQ